MWVAEKLDWKWLKMAVIQVYSYQHITDSLFCRASVGFTEGAVNDSVVGFVSHISTKLNLTLATYFTHSTGGYSVHTYTTYRNIITSIADCLIMCIL
jgi:hypothetical protein